MPTFIADLLTQVKAIWARLDGGQRLTIVAILIATAAGMGGLVWYAGQPDYVVLRSFETASNQMEALKALEQANINRKIDGLAITVPSTDLARARLALHTAGVDDGSETESIISQLSSTAAGNRMRLHNKGIRLIEAKLKQSPMIREAVITAGEKRRQLYSDQEKNENATVTITVARGADFLTAASLASDATASGLSLPRRKVKVYDAKTGEMFTHRDNGGGASTGAGFLRLQDEWQFRLHSAASRTIMRFQDDVHVTVNLTLKPEATHRTGPNLTPEGITPNTVETTEESAEYGAGRVAAANPSGAPVVGGTATNAGQSGKSKSSNKTKKTQIAESLYGVKTVAQLAPFIEQISVAVMINEGLIESQKGSKQPDEIKKGIETLVKTAIGFKEDRDKIAAEVFKFPELPPAEEEAGMDMIGLAKDFAPHVAQVFAVLLVLMFLRGMLKKAQLSKKEPAPAIDNPLTEELEENLAPEEVAKRMRREIESAINEDPAAISRMLDNWLTEQKA